MKTNYKIWFDASNIYLEREDGKVGHLPLIDYKPLFYASEEEKNEYKLSPFGVHWEKLDEDLCFEGFIF